MLISADLVFRAVHGPYRIQPGAFSAGRPKGGASIPASDVHQHETGDTQPIAAAAGVRSASATTGRFTPPWPRPAAAKQPDAVSPAAEPSAETPTTTKRRRSRWRELAKW